MRKKVEAAVNKKTKNFYDEQTSQNISNNHSTTSTNYINIQNKLYESISTELSHRKP